MLEPYYSGDGIEIYHGDTLMVLPEITRTVDAVVTDPPYSSGGTFRGDRNRTTVEKYVQSGMQLYRPEFAGDNKDQRSFLVWSIWWMGMARDLSAVGAHLVSFIDWRQIPLLTDALQISGWSWRGLATWWKPGIRMQRGSFSHSAEYIVYGTNGPAQRNFGSVQNVFRCAPVSVGGKEHIAEKPEPLLQWILDVTPLGCLILDPFMGVGTTLIAAHNTGRRAIGIDCDERYCEIAAKRLEKAEDGDTRPVFD